MPDLARADRARQLLQNPLINELIDELIAMQVSRIMSSNGEDIHVREDAYRMARALEMLRAQLQACAGETAHERARAEAEMMASGAVKN